MYLDKKKSIFVFVFSLIAFLVLAIPFRNLLKINYVMEVRPAAVLNPILGMFFGMPAILATTLGNFVLDFQSGVPIIQALVYSIPQFLYGFIPYYIWKKLNKNEINKTAIDGMSKIIHFFISILIGSLSFSIVTGIIVGLFNRSLSFLMDFTIFTFVNNIVMNLFLGFPLIIILDRLINKNNITLCEKYLLVSFIIETICICTIICVTLCTNVNIKIVDSHFWEKIYFMCIVAILFLIGISIAIIATQLDKELKEQNYEISVASTIQRSMLPTKFNLDDDRFAIFASMRPAKLVGGDFYDFYYIDKDNLLFLIADVSGKGIPSALFMMQVVSTIRNYAMLGLEVDEIMNKTNISISKNNPNCYFVTVWMGILNIETGVINYCNAGHNSPIIKINNKSKLIQMDKSVIIGVSKNIKYQKQEISLSNGDMIYLYTDGVTEARNIKNEMFTTEKLINFLDKIDSNPQTVCENVLNEIDNFSLKAEQFDDITMLSLKYKKEKRYA